MRPSNPSLGSSRVEISISGVDTAEVVPAAEEVTVELVVVTGVEEAVVECATTTKKVIAPEETVADLRMRAAAAVAIAEVVVWDLAVVTTGVVTVEVKAGGNLDAQHNHPPQNH